MAEIRERNGVTVVQLGERYDALLANNLDKLSDELLTIIRAQARPKLLLDFSQTEYINSSFIEVAFRVWKRALQKDGMLACCGVHGFCQEVLHVTHLDKIWTYYENQEEAVQAMAAM